VTAPIRTAFVMEQALGHVTHYKNLRGFTERQSDISPIWLPIPYEVRGAERLVPVLRNTWSVRASWRARRALAAARATNALDAVVFHTQVTSLFSLNIMRKIPTLISLDATPINYDKLGPHYHHRPAGGGFVDRKKFEWNQRVFQAAGRLVTWSRWAQTSLIEDYNIEEGATRVVSPGANRAYFELGKRRTGASAPLETRDRVRILFVGGDFYRKGGNSLLEALKGPLANRVELDIVTQHEIASRPTVRVHHGLEPNSPALLRLFAEADLFVLPTYADCMGLVLMEAAAAGLPVIATNVGALPETMHVGESGMLVPVGDHAALRAAISALVDCPDRRARMGRAGHALARQKFDAERNNRLLLDLIGELVEARPVSGRAA
jgi:glycosyltransferase involved in cell wall biosynthesis